MRGYPREDKNVAIKMRRKGKSYKEIKKLLGVPTSTLSNWLAKENWSKKIKAELEKRSIEQATIRIETLSKVRGEHLARLYKEAQIEAIKEFEHFKWYPLFIAGISLYWGEGDKATRSHVRLSNIDPNMIRTFILFLREICGIPEEKIRAGILLYPDLDPEVCLSYWSDQICLPRQNFIKCVTIQGRHKVNRLQYGVCTVTVSSTYLKVKVLIWLGLLSEELARQQAGIVYR